MEHNLKITRMLQQQPHSRNALVVLRSRLESAVYLLRTLWLFTYADVKTTIVPSTAFAVLQRLGVSAFMKSSENTSPVAPLTLTKILMTVFWIWITLLGENIANQRKSIDEDRLNKSWRPLPAGRMTADQATTLMWLVYSASVLFGFLSGAQFESMAVVVLSIWYNDFDGAGSSWYTRNFVNACGITTVLCGALTTMLHNHLNGPMAISQHPLVANSNIRTWIILVWIMILTSIQVQDIPDQEGDAMINRKTMPLVLGDVFTRWTVVLTVLLWSSFCPYFWSLPSSGYIVPLTSGAYVAWRTMTKREVKDDKLTHKLWNLWFMVFFTLPLQAV